MLKTKNSLSIRFGPANNIISISEKPDKPKAI